MTKYKTIVCFFCVVLNLQGVAGQVFPKGLTETISISEISEDTIGEMILFSPKLSLQKGINALPSRFSDIIKKGLASAPGLQGKPWAELDTMLTLDYCITVQETEKDELHCRALKYIDADTTVFTLHITKNDGTFVYSPAVGRGQYVDFISSTVHFYLFNPFFTSSDLIKNISSTAKQANPTKTITLPYLYQVINSLDVRSKKVLTQFSKEKQIYKFKQSKTDRQ